MKTIYDHIAKVQKTNEHWAICTVVRSRGSAPRKAGAKMLVNGNAKILGTIGGGDLEKKVIENAINVLNNGTPEMFEHKLNYDHGMCCGGVVEIFIEPIINMKQLYIFGAGHTGAALAGFAAKLGFQVHLVDERVEIVDDLQLEDVEIINKNHKQALKQIDFGPHTFVAVITHNHAYDREIIEFCAKQKFAYLGMIGSQRKVEMAKKGYIAGQRLTEEDMAKIDWPIGLDINAVTPEEIAISILGKMIQVKNQEDDK